MKKAKTNPFIWILVLVILVAGAFGCESYANQIQTDNGKVEISQGQIETADGILTYKLYKPKTATEKTPASAVLLLHGYQNDRETSSSYAIELARRGVVVMSLDEYGHGYSTIGLENRGYVNHKVSTNFGMDSEEDGTYKAVGGSKRYRVLMNFSNLSFFNDRYTKDDAGNAIWDSSCGGSLAYQVLSAMPFVDSSRMALSGHSMGTWSSWSVAADYADSDIEPKAIVLQCGEIFTEDAYNSAKYHFNNVLLLQAKYEEFSYFRDYQYNVTEELLKTPLRTNFLGTTSDQAAFDTTYGSFADGSARRIELCITNHRLVPTSDKGLTAALEWFDKAIGLDSNSLPSSDHVAMTKEWMTLAAMLLTLLAIVPLMELLLATKFFGSIVQPKPPVSTAKTTKGWWKGAIITVLIAGATFPFMTQLGHALLPLPEGIMRMTVGNGFFGWYLLLIIIMLITNAISAKGAKKKKQEFNLYTMGFSSAKKKKRLDGVLWGKCILLVLILMLMVYAVVFVFQKLYDLDLRIIWPFFKTFNMLRFGQFLAYFWIFAIFYLLNNSKIMGGMRTKGSYYTGAKGFFSDWWRNLFAMAGGLILVTLIEYVPFFLGIGPGADVLFGSTFGGPFMSLLILFVPQVFVFSLWCTYAYRRTGTVIPGALVTAALACWIVTGGSSFL